MWFGRNIDAPCWTSGCRTCNRRVFNIRNELKIGFVGFGEAGYNLAKGLRGVGVTRMFAYDINTDAPKLGARIRQRATETEVALLESSERLTGESDILLSVVTANSAAEAAAQT